MISVQLAQQIIEENVFSLSPLTLPLDQAAGLVLAENLYAPIDIPSFQQSSMDGYAFCFEDWQKTKHLIITGQIPAGSTHSIPLHPGQAVRIFTGAAVPPGADTVVMQEKVKVEKDRLCIEDEKLQAGSHVRPQGSEIKKGELALEKNTVLTPAAIGFLAAIGINEVNVFPKPCISIIITGNELQQPGKPLQYGQVYEANSYALKAILGQLQIGNTELYFVDDQPERVTAILEKALQKSDLVLLSGGISVGDYDFVLQAAQACAVKTLFYKVKQKPGKPLYFGKKGEKIVFGLPGNPSSTLTCFYLYVIPALEKLSHRKPVARILPVPLSKPIQKAAGLTHFLKGFYDGNVVSVLDAQESYRLSSFARANCLIRIDEETTSVNKGDLVDVYLFPQ